MAIQLFLCLIAIVTLAHLINGRVPDWVYVFLPLAFLVPDLVSVEFCNMLGWLGLILVAGGSTTTYFADKAADTQENKRTKSKMSAIAGIGFAATIIGAILAFCDQVQSDNNSVAAQEEITRLSKESLQLSKQNTAKQEEITNLLTGGDSIFYLHFANSPTMKPRANYAISGKYDVPQVRISYYRIPLDEEIRKAEDKQALVRSQLKELPQIGPIAVGVGQFLNAFSFPSEGENSYRFFFLQGRRQFVELVVIKRLADSTYRFAYRVFEVVGKDGLTTKIKLLPTLSYTDTEVSPTSDNIVPLIDSPENLRGFEIVE